MAKVLPSSEDLCAVCHQPRIKHPGNLAHDFEPIERQQEWRVEADGTVRPTLVEIYAGGHLVCTMEAQGWSQSEVLASARDIVAAHNATIKDSLLVEKGKLAQKLRGSIGFAYISQDAVFNFITAFDKLDKEAKK